MAEVTTDTMMPATHAQAIVDFTTGASGTEADYSIWQDRPCAVHHTPNPSGYAAVYEVTLGQTISHLNANTLKWAIRSLSKGFARPDYGHGYVYSVPPSFTTAVSGSVVRKNEWAQLRTTLVQFGAVLPDITTDTTITSSFFNELKYQYDYYKGLCLCNSDCYCNAVCSCNADCSCNYI